MERDLYHKPGLFVVEGLVDGEDGEDGERAEGNGRSGREKGTEKVERTRNTPDLDMEVTELNPPQPVLTRPGRRKRRVGTKAPGKRTITASRVTGLPEECKYSLKQVRTNIQGVIIDSDTAKKDFSKTPDNSEMGTDESKIMDDDSKARSDVSEIRAEESQPTTDASEESIEESESNKNDSVAKTDAPELRTDDPELRTDDSKVRTKTTPKKGRLLLDKESVEGMDPEDIDQTISFLKTLLKRKRPS